VTRPDVCLFFDAYYIDDFVLANFHAYERAAADICDIRLLFHDRGEDTPDLPKQSLVVTDQDIFGAIPQSKSRGDLIPGNAELKTLAGARRMPGYDCYLSIEYDVLCTRDMRQVLTRLLDVSRGDDVALSYLNSRDPASQWVWWAGLHGPDGAPPVAACFGSFLPVVMYSRTFISVYEAALADGWRGHAETLVPTIARRHGLRVLDISRCDPPFTAYPQFKIHPVEGLSEGWPDFIHPIKDLGMYDRLPQGIARNLKVPHAF